MHAEPRLEVFGIEVPERHGAENRIVAETLPKLEDAPPVLYHYTRQPGVLGILDRGRLWASQIHYLNDAEEFQHAWRLLDAWLQQQLVGAAFRELLSVDRELKHHVCVTSFTTRGDDLSQWRAYTSVGDAYAIGFSTDLLLEVANRYGGRLVKCAYDAAAQNALIAEVVGRHYTSFQALYEHVGGNLRPHMNDALEIADAFMREFFVVAPILKSPAFVAEDEYRIIFPPPHKDLPLLFRPGRHFLIPHLELSWAELEHPRPIVDVVVGPGDHTDLAVQAIRSMLLLKNLLLTSVRVTQVPYRG